MTRETLLTLVTDGIMERPIFRKPLAQTSSMLGVLQAWRYSGSKPSMMIITMGLSMGES